VVVADARLEIQDAHLVNGRRNLGAGKALPQDGAELRIQLHDIEPIARKHPRCQLFGNRTHARPNLEDAEGAIPVYRTENRGDHRAGKTSAGRPKGADGGRLLERLLEEP
jgi:hypothetical protein